LRLKAEEGDGKLPVIQTYCQDDNTIQRDVISSLAGDVEFENITFIGEPAGNVEGTDPSYPRTFLSGSSRITSITVKGCVFLGTYQSITRPGAAQRVEFRDCLFANLGRVKDGLIGNGRIVDTRGNQIDTVILEHNTAVNTVNKLIRHTGDKSLGLVSVNHNTFVNHIGSPFEIQVFKDLNITNNLFIDPLVLGSDPSDTTLVNEYDDFIGVTWVESMPLDLMVSEENPAPTVNIHSNIYSHSTAVKDLHQSLNLTLGRFYRADIEAALSDPEKAFIEKSVSLSNIPNPPVNVVSWWYDPDGADIGNGNLTPPEDVTMDRKEENDYAYWFDVLDCSYPHTDQDLMGTEDEWVGDPRWADATSGLFSQLSPEMMKISGYTTVSDLVIRFQLEHASDISVQVYNIEGKKVASRVHVPGFQGENTIEISKVNMPVGIYLIKVFTNNKIGSIKTFVD
jgi:hypothetical protein